MELRHDDIDWCARVDSHYLVVERGSTVDLEVDVAVAKRALGLVKFIVEARLRCDCNSLFRVTTVARFERPI